MPEFGVVGGSGLYEIPGAEVTDSVKIGTPYGDPSDLYRIVMISGREVAFLPRHGSVHSIQPHRINYRANLWGFRELGVEKIFSIGASGGISSRLLPGMITVPDQIIDMTSGRESTFHDGDEVVHIDFTDPFCPDLRKHIFRASASSGIPVAEHGCYLCTNGPRLETAAEIRTFSAWGADMVGMTMMPEASLARELQICYAAVSVITNAAAGRALNRLTTREVVETMRGSIENVKSLLKEFISLELAPGACTCRQSLDEAKM